MQTIIQILVSALAVAVAAYLVPGVIVNSFLTAVIVAIVLALLNTFIKPILVALTLPVNILTLGLFTFIIDVFLIWVASSIVPGFAIASFMTALVYGLVLALISAVLFSFA